MTYVPLGLAPEALATVREQTSGVLDRIHLDNCGSALMPAPVADVIRRAFERDVAFGGYVAQEQQADNLDATYKSLTRLFGGTVDDYAFVGSAVDGWTKAFYSIPFGAGDNIITAYNEYCSNFVAYLQMKERAGIDIRVAAQAPAGGIDLGHLESLIDDRTKLISISHMPSSSGEINQVKDVGTIARKADVLFQLDACQSAGHIPVNVDDIGCDIMTGTARKFLRGPRGIGFLYVNQTAREQMEPVVLTNQAAEWSSRDAYTLRSDARVFEAWERSVVNQLGFGAAIDYLLELGVEKATTQIAQNAGYLRTALANLPNVRVACPSGASSAIITLNVLGKSPSEVKAELERQSIAVQIASVVHTRLDLEDRGIDSAVRVSPHYYNNREDLDAFLTAVETL